MRNVTPFGKRSGASYFHTSAAKPWNERKWQRPRGLSPFPTMLVISILFLTYLYQSKLPAGVTTNNPVEATNISFGMCGHGNWYDCVVDGDTFYLHGQSIRIADIDAPETHPSRCAHEAELGERATNRLYDLLNAGPFKMEPLSGRDEDKYGRKLRIVERDGKSLGAILVSEGLAREWTGHRMPWCS